MGFEDGKRSLGKAWAGSSPQHKHADSSSARRRRPLFLPQRARGRGDAGCGQQWSGRRLRRARWCWQSHNGQQQQQQVSVAWMKVASGCTLNFNCPPARKTLRVARDKGLLPRSARRGWSGWLLDFDQSRGETPAGPLPSPPAEQFIRRRRHRAIIDQQPPLSPRRPLASSALSIP